MADNLNKRLMLDAGLQLGRAFCVANRLTVPAFELVPSGSWPFDVCAYYRPTKISMCIERTAHVGTTGMQWSYPGYIADRTAYGVIAHELGHHVDVSRSIAKRAYFGDYSARVRRESGEARLTSYCPNDAEWFAEMMRLFITNPDLLRLLRPKTFEILSGSFNPVPNVPVSAVINDFGLTPWDHVLHDAPRRTLDMAARKIEAARTGQLN